MRSNPAEYEMIAPGSLPAVLSMLAREPGAWLPVAGGTDVMVQYAAGKLSARKLVSIWNLPELRRITAAEDEIRIGAACTYTDIRKHTTLANEFPLLQRAASWTGGIANQNRGTIGGNIVNASPAADSLPALLVYDTELILVSIRGEHRVAYTDFHTGYKKMQLAPDELIQSICLQRNFSQYFSYARKVGARKAQAIAKVCIAGLGHVVDGTISDVRIALGSVAPVPVRLRATEHAVKGKVIDVDLLQRARKTVIAEIKPIDDIRSTARYRSAVAGNLVVEFLNRLSNSRVIVEDYALNSVLRNWNRLAGDQAVQAILPCCESSSWAKAMAARRPLADEPALLAASSEIWWNLTKSDWMEVFRSHPRIGEARALQPQSAQSVEWSAQEQRNVGNTEDAERNALSDANQEYERRFGWIFIACATGKTATEILQELRRRLQNDPATELHEAAEQLRQITEIRLKKWLQT
jgi:OHCU decarboxylase